MTERHGIARLTRVAKPTQSEGLMPPLRQPPAKSPAGRPPTVRVGLQTPTGVAKLTPRSAAAERAARNLRQVMGRFATGVTVVTTMHRDTIHGMTANAFLSVSLRPPLVLVSLGRCRMTEMLPLTGRYGVSVLAHDQEQFAAHFAAQQESPTPPTFVWHEGLPLPQSLSAFFSTWLGLKVSTRRALMVISCPVCGLRPARAFLSRTTKFPNPEILIFSPRSRVPLIVSNTVSTMSAASFFEKPPTFS